MGKKKINNNKKATSTLVPVGMYQYEGTLRSKNGHFRASVRNLYIFRYFLGINALIGRGFFQYQVCSTHLMAFSFHPLIACLIYSVLGVLYCEIVDLYRKLICQSHLPTSITSTLLATIHIFFSP